MADVWYYAQNGQQTGPVSSEQLQQLARSGRICDTDLVWREGLPQWIQARSVGGLFVPHEAANAPIPFAPDDRPARREDDPEDRPRRRPRGYDEDPDDDRPRRRRRAYDEDNEDEDDDYPRRRLRRRAAGGWTGLPTGAKVAILVGGLVLVLLAVAVPVLVFLGNLGPDDGDRTFHGRLTLNDPPDRVRGVMGCRSRTHSYRMKAGTMYTIRMLSNQFDSYLRLEDPSGNNLMEDDDGDGFPNARIVFIPPRDGTYRLVATTFVPHTGGTYQVVVTRSFPPVGRR
jgi:hypothetical protein